MKKKDEIKVCLVGSSGGHLTHLYMLKPFWKDKNRFWVTFDKEDARSLLEGEKVYPCYFPTNRSIKALIKNTKIAWDVLHKEKPDLIISCGAAVAVPFFYIGKMMGAKLVYIEVFDRIDKPTMTGKMVYPIVDKFVVQYKGTYVGAKFIMPVPYKHRVLRAPLEQQVRIEDSHAAIVTPEEFEQAQKVIMLQNGNHQTGNYTKHQYPLKGKVYCGYCQKLMKYRVLKKLGPSFNCRFSATAVDSPCKRIPISEEILEHIVRNALTEQIKQAEHILGILHERERKALICFSTLERQEEKLSAEKEEIVKQRVALYEQYADGNMSKEEFIRQRDAYRVQEDERMAQIQRLRTEKNQVFQPVKKDTDNLQAVMNTVGEAGDVMHLSQNVVETFIDRIEVFNDERVKIRFTFEDALNSCEEK